MGFKFRMIYLKADNENFILNKKFQFFLAVKMYMVVLFYMTILGAISINF